MIHAASAALGLYLVGCWPLNYSEECKDDPRFCPVDGTGGGNGPDPTCEADPTEDPTTVTDRCAVFVSASAASGGDGTMAKPYASLAEAIANAQGKRVLACSSGAFAESVRIDAAADVIGGFDCDAGWTWSAEARSAIEAPANEVALTLASDASGARVRNFSIRAADATEPGGSSLAVAVADIEAELARVDVTAGNGMNGARGETPADAKNGADASDNVSDVCDATVYGGMPGVTMCDDGETRGGLGGLGGKPGENNGYGQSGQDGAPPPEDSTSAGLGGAGFGQPGGASNCNPGATGAPGVNGQTGAPGGDTTLTLAGITGGNAGSGTSGARGQGGGGGGGTKAGTFCSDGTQDYIQGVGASGGGGGAGGCGGNGGSGGKAGGSSIGILSLGTKLVLTEVTIAVGAAGHGGMGGAGKRGGSGGSGAPGGSIDTDAGPGAREGCDGGSGGPGGDGGAGGGGRGGHAVGIAYAVTPGPVATEVPFTGGTPGDGGLPGQGGAAENQGDAGVSGACWDFAANARCPLQ
ncbi:hypothetical protein WME91_56775 [Sorangium sp. So ce269]